MHKVTTWLLEETSAQVAYTQSDEISLIWWIRNFKTKIIFDGRIQKMTSVIASMCSVQFNKYLAGYLPEKRIKRQCLIVEFGVFPLQMKLSII